MSDLNTTIDLSQFEEKIHPAGCPTPLNIVAYRMDGDSKKNIPNMAKFADLGTPFCCDYLYIDPTGPAILIEDTYLERTIQNIKKELGSFSKDEQSKDEQSKDEQSKDKETKYIIENLRRENCLKVYGALLILCRLAHKYQDIANRMADKTFLFYFVINDEENVKALSNMDLPSMLEQKLESALSGTLKPAKLVKVLFLSQVEEALHPNRQ